MARLAAAPCPRCWVAIASMRDRSSSGGAPCAELAPRMAAVIHTRNRERQITKLTPVDRAESLVAETDPSQPAHGPCAAKRRRRFPCTAPRIRRGERAGPTRYAREGASSRTAVPPQVPGGGWLARFRRLRNQVGLSPFDEHSMGTRA